MIFHFVLQDVGANGLNTTSFDYPINKQDTVFLQCAILQMLWQQKLFIVSLACLFFLVSSH
ncbi:MAG: hypothetical protein ACKPKO_07500, partial [Candidatus Fonsibacter sp.]